MKDQGQLEQCMRWPFSYQEIAHNTAPTKKDGSWPKLSRQQISSHLLSLSYGLLSVSILLKCEMKCEDVYSSEQEVSFM